MAEANFKPIKKISVEKMEVMPNLDIEESYKDFDWEALYKQLYWLPGGGLNKAHEAIDRHANGDKRDKIAMIW